MVQRLADPTVPHHTASTPENGDRTGNTEDGMMSIEEYAQSMRELNKKRSMRAPRRGWSMTEYSAASSAPHSSRTTTTSYIEHEASIPENSVPRVPISLAPSTPISEDLPKEQTIQLPLRPKLPPPRRSYSVQDYEPAPPNQAKPSSRLKLLDLPSEIHYLFCDYLDPIDSVAFGLAHSKLYGIHRKKYGTVKLSSRYSGPNDREWAWRGAGVLVRSSSNPAGHLAHMRTKGQVYCRKCGIHRCELHRHLKEWMGERMEYCEIKEMYGKHAGDEAKPYCYMKSPKNPHRCGRHGGKKANTA